MNSKSNTSTNSSSLPPLVVVCEKGVSPSVLLMLTRLNPSAGRVVLVCAEQSVSLGRVPRHIEIVAKQKSISELVKEFSKDAVFVFLRDDLLLVPEALAIAASCAKLVPDKIVTFVDATGRHDVLGVQFVAMRHWGNALSPARSFACTGLTLQTDEDVLTQFWDAPAHVFWSALESLQNRRVLCPIPSLAAPLPVTDASPPGVNWKQLQEFVSNST